MVEEPAKRGRQRFDEQFKREAVQMMEQSKKPMRQVSRELGVHENNLRNWVEKYGKRENSEDSKSMQEMTAEIKRLRKEVAERAEEVAILKKATAFFAINGKG
jgi:transposase